MGSRQIGLEEQNSINAPIMRRIYREELRQLASVAEKSVAEATTP